MKISIDGNIGCGKTSVLSHVCQQARIPVFLEPVNDWKDWLALYYQDPSRWGFSFNIKVLLSFHQWSDNKFLSLYERSPIPNKYVFADLQKDEGKITDLEYGLFDQIYQKLSWCPDKIIYIRTNPEICMDRMIRRARDCESKVPFEYIKAIHNKYEKLYIERGIPNTEIVVIDGNQALEDVVKDVFVNLNVAIE